MWKYLLIFLLLSFTGGCSGDDALQQNVDCGSVGCTEQFETISIEVKDDAGVKVPLDSFEVTDLLTNADLTANYSEEELQIFRDNGRYPIYNDSFVEVHPNEDRSIVFKGFIGGNVVVTETYVVRADCCHVSLVSGDEVLIIN